MGTIMGRERLGTSASRSSAVDKGRRRSTHNRLRRNRPLTWQSALLPLIPLALLATMLDVALYVFVRDHYAKHGHLGFPLDVSAAALLCTAATIFGCVASCRGLRTQTKTKRARRPPDETAKHR